MVLEEHVTRFRFFRRVGAFTIRPGCGGEVAASLAYAASVLRDPANALGLFPRAASAIPPTGRWAFSAAWSASWREHGAPVAILPLAMRCEFYENQRPEALFLFDRVLRGRRRASFPEAGWLEERVAGLLEEAGRAAAGEAPGPRAPGGAGPGGGALEGLSRRPRRRGGSPRLTCRPRCPYCAG